jgi:hypothetical protein
MKMPAASLFGHGGGGVISTAMKRKKQMKELQVLKKLSPDLQKKVKTLKAEIKKRAQKAIVKRAKTSIKKKIKKSF